MALIKLELRHYQSKNFIAPFCFDRMKCLDVLNLGVNEQLLKQI